MGKTVLLLVRTTSKGVIGAMPRASVTTTAPIADAAGRTSFPRDTWDRGVMRRAREIKTHLNSVADMVRVMPLPSSVSAT